MLLIMDKKSLLEYCDLRQKELTADLNDNCNSVTCYMLKARIKEIELLRKLTTNV